MATVIIIARVMPLQGTNLETIKTAARAALESEGARNISFEEKPVAFGIKALMTKIDFPEEKGTDIVEQTLAAIKGVSSVTLEDYRRALG